MRNKTMFHVKNHRQLNIFDPWALWGPQRRQILGGSVSALYIPGTARRVTLRRHYHDCYNRPSKELYAIMRLMGIQQVHDCTDQEAVGQFCFNIQWHYALKSPRSPTPPRTSTTKRSGPCVITCPRTRATPRSSPLQILAKLFKPDLSKQRMDSVHVKSNCAILAASSLPVLPSVRTDRESKGIAERRSRPSGPSAPQC